MPGDQRDSGGIRLLDRMLAAGLSVERIGMHVAAGPVRVDGERVTDPQHLAPQPAVISLALD